jgi:hypothetical protein
MVDGKQYFAQFPDEDPARLQAHSAKLLATLRALEKELRPYIAKQSASRVDADDSNT